ncbi:uncharacterized protein KQ657_004401 [Scheffersomyces spartinae]|uniref:Arrestin-like N-terminal domain-containing protein n=1 Tax=Scheffersomyces spartinae TaxID=45513 RepID=A0A9P7VBA8_9ASCO|nr:uncharacterized protein KQ657_004401 [Scheffersomyces spartinae]KAG7194722.1 hypothetical protein KQ657_004401 [Scheffersomyces spartinae]
MSTKLEVNIDRIATGDTFTNYDIVQGTIELQVLERISLSKIEVILEGTSKSKVYYKERSGKPNNYKNYNVQNAINKHTQVYQELIVFPSKGTYNKGRIQEFNLDVGRYSYPFSFQLPMDNDCASSSASRNTMKDHKARVQHHRKSLLKSIPFNSLKKKPSKPMGQIEAKHVTNQLPPSFYLNDDASIKYGVRATLFTTQLDFFGDRSAYGPFVFLPLDLEGPLPDAPKYELNIRESFLCSKMVHTPGTPLHFFFELRLNDPANFTPGEKQSYTLHIGTRHQFTNQSTDVMPTIYLMKIKTSLLCITDIRADDDRLTGTLHKTQHVKTLVLVEKDLNKYPIELSGMERKLDQDSYSVEVPLECYSHSIPTDLPPTFETCNLSRSYKLELVISYAFDPAAKKGFLRQFQLGSIKKVKLRTENMRVVSGIYLNRGALGNSSLNSVDSTVDDNDTVYGLPSHEDIKYPWGQLVRRDYCQEKEYYLE